MLISWKTSFATFSMFQWKRTRCTVYSPWTHFCFSPFHTAISGLPFSHLQMTSAASLGPKYTLLWSLYSLMSYSECRFHKVFCSRRLWEWTCVRLEGPIERNAWYMTSMVTCFCLACLCFLSPRALEIYYYSSGFLFCLHICVAFRDCQHVTTWG